MTKEIYRNEDVCVLACSLKEIFKDRFDDFMHLYRDIKHGFQSEQDLLPFLVTFEPSEFYYSLLLFRAVSLVNTVGKEPIMIVVLSYVPADTSLYAEDIAESIFRKVDMETVLERARNYSIEQKRRGDFLLFMFDSLDFAAEAANILRDYTDSYLLKEGESYSLIVCTENHDLNTVLLPEIMEYSIGCKSLMQASFEQKMEKTQNIIFKDKAIERLNNYRGHCEKR